MLNELLLALITVPSFTFEKSDCMLTISFKLDYQPASAQEVLLLGCSTGRVIKALLDVCSCVELPVITIMMGECVMKLNAEQYLQIEGDISSAKYFTAILTYVGIKS